MRGTPHKRVEINGGEVELKPIVPEITVERLPGGPVVKRVSVFKTKVGFMVQVDTIEKYPIPTHFSGQDAKGKNCGVMLMPADDKAEPGMTHITVKGDYEVVILAYRYGPSFLLLDPGYDKDARCVFSKEIKDQRPVFRRGMEKEP